MSLTLFDLLVNLLLQIGFFAIVAVFFSRFVRKATAKHQNSFYVAALLFCLVAPVINTLWHSPSTAAVKKSQQQVSPDAGTSNHLTWIWQRKGIEHEHFIIPLEFQSWIVCGWGLFVLLRLARFGQAVEQVHQLRKKASLLSPAQVKLAGQIIGAEHRVALLQSTAIDDPATAGVFHPAIILPKKMLPDLGEREFLAVVAHEYCHIRRRDYLVQILCELISLPVAWHPGIRYLMAKISQTRELACDDYAATCVGTRRAYAHTLLRLASISVHVPRANAIGLGIFDGDNLEVRIMKLTEKKSLLSRAAVIALALGMTASFGAGAVLARAMSLQAGSKPSSTAERFAGTWNWMFEGRSFSTMILVPDGTSFKGTVTPSRIKLNDDGGLLRADPSADSTPAPITRATLEGSALHITVGDGFAFTVTLKDDTHAEIHPKGAPPNMKPIPAEKVQ